MRVNLPQPTQSYDYRNEAEARRAVERAFTQIPGLGMTAYTVADLPAVDGPYRWIFVSDEAGGAVPAFNDGVNWRRCTDRAVVS